MSGKRRSPSVSEAIAAYGDVLTARAPATEKNARMSLRQFVLFLLGSDIDIAKTRTDELPAEVLEHFYIWRLKTHGRGRSQRSTAASHVWQLVSFFRFLDQQSWLAEGLRYERQRDGVTSLMGPLRHKSARVDDNVAVVVCYATEQPLPSGRARIVALRDIAVLRCLYGTALRRAELCSLDRGDLQGEQAIVRGKGEKDRMVFFDRASLDAIAAYLKERADNLAPLFLRHDDGRGEPGPDGEHWRLDQQTVWHIVVKYATLAGVVGISPHSLRHFKAKTMLNAGAKLEEVQDLLGHESPVTTKKVYAQYTTQHLREAFDRYSVPFEEVAARAAGK